MLIYKLIAICISYTDARADDSWKESDDPRLGYLPGYSISRNSQDDQAIGLGAEEHMDLLDQLMTNTSYNKKIKPYLNEQLNVSVNIFVDTMSDISESSMDYEMTIFFRQFWSDPRLAWGEINGTKYRRHDGSSNIDGTYLDKIWEPDIFFVDEKDSKRHLIMTRNMLLELHPDGQIMLSERLSLKIGCHMDLKFYPFDLQVCPIHVESYSYREEQLDIKWHSNVTIQVSDDLTLPTFSLVSNLIRHDCSRKHITGDFSCLEGFFVLRRHISYYLIHIYIPSVLCVIVSWMSFWIKLESAPARVTCGILTFLAISSQTQSFNSELPKVSYIKAIDVWMFVCNLFVFLSLMEYAFAQVLLRREQREIEIMRYRRSSFGSAIIQNAASTSLLQRRIPPSRESVSQNGNSVVQRKISEHKRTSIGDKYNSNNGNIINSPIVSTTRNGTVNEPGDSDQLEESIRRKEDIVNGLSGLWVDRVSRKLFPIAFTVFNVFYWATCCSVPKEDLPDDCIVQPI